MKKTKRLASAFICSTLIFMGCALEQPQSGKQDFLYTLTLGLKANDSREALETRYGGEVTVWSEGQYAVLGFHQLPSQDILKLEHTAFEANTESITSSQSNVVSTAGLATIWSGGLSTIWSGGLSTIWSGGLSTIWSGGLSTIWSGGTFQWMPQNNSIWQQIRLEKGQKIASNLGLGVKVAVIDTGVDLKHPGLSQALAPAAEWRDFVDGDAVPQEVGVLGVGAYGHGTSVAGIVRQIAPRATILPLRVLDANGKGTALRVVAAVAWAVQKGAKIINLSLGSEVDLRSLEVALRAATAKGVYIVASVGNKASTVVTFPASRSINPLRLSVTSVDAMDAKSVFSNYGEAVEIAAPGELVHGPAPDLRLAAWSGTSMATPVAAGALALALGQELKVPARDLADTLVNYSDDIYRNGLNSSFLHKVGRGRINLAKFLANAVVSK